MNELIFFAHIFLQVFLILAALRIGKEALIACLGLIVVIGNLFVTKQMVCFGLSLTCSDVYTIGALFSLNLLQEFYGKALAKKAIWTAFFLLFFFLIMSQVHLLYRPSSFDSMQPIFKALLAASPRIMIASFVVALLSQKIDVELYGFIKKRLPGKSLLLRFGGASLVSQLFDTILFSIVGLYGIVHSLFDIIAMSYLIKIAIIICMAPFTQFAKRFAHDPVQV